MNTTTLSGIFPETKPVHRKNFLKENIKNVKALQGLVQDSQLESRSQTIKPGKYKNVPAKVYSNVFTSHKPSKIEVKQPSKLMKFQKKPFVKNKIEIDHKINRGVQTEKPEDVVKMYETIKQLNSSRMPQRTLRKQISKTQDQGDQTDNIAKNLQKLDLENSQNYIQQNIKNLKTKKVPEEPIDPLQPPPNYQRGILPKYLRRKDGMKITDSEGDNTVGLVLLPDEERREYLRVARENYAALIKELNSMPVSNDTLKKKRRKMEIEDELKRLEEVIKIFQKPKVFVKADM